MRNGREPAAAEDDDGPKLISLQDKHEADRLLQQALAAGEIDQAEFKRRRGKAYAAVTRASCGRRPATGPGRPSGPTRPPSGARSGYSWRSWPSPP